MNDPTLAFVSLLGAGAAAGGIALLSRDDPEEPTIWFRLTWPREVDTKGVVGFLRTIASDRQRHIVALEATGSGGQLSYRIGLAEKRAPFVIAQLKSYIPGASAQLIEHDITRCPLSAWQIRMSSHQRALRTSQPESVVRAIITALSTMRNQETATVQWLLGPRLEAVTPAEGLQRTVSWTDTLKNAVVESPKLNPDTRKAIKEKSEEAGFRAICRIGVLASSDQAADVVASRLVGALRTAEAPGVRLTLKRDNPEHIALAKPPRSWPLAVNVEELASLLGWPLGDVSYPGINREGARLLPPSPSVARRGRILAAATYPGCERPLALGATDSLQHLHLLGPTGVGKSTLMLNLIVQDMAAGRGVVVIDPKGDLIQDVLERVPTGRQKDVVVLDPADERRPVGLNVLQGGGRSSELIADQVLAVFHDLYRENWGPRTQDILHASLLTLAGKPGMTLCALPILLSNRAFRKKVTRDITDDIALKPFWNWFETLSEGERQQATAPVMNKLRAFLLRPRMRAVIGQAEPHFDIETVFSSGAILLVSLAKGLLGPEAAALLGSLTIAHLWQTALGRARIPASSRAPVFIHIDEFQDYIHLPTDLADVLAQARGLGVGLTLAHQHLAQLTPALRFAVLANARSRVCFQLGHEDAKLVATGLNEIGPLDLQSLGRYEAYLSLVADGNVTPYASGRTIAPPEPTSNAQALRQMSRERFGRDLADIERDIAAQLGQNSVDEESPIGRRRTA